MITKEFSLENADSFDLINKLPKVKLSTKEIHQGLKTGNLWIKYNFSGSLNVVNIVEYHDTECSDKPVLYAEVRYPYESHVSLVILLQSATLSIY